MSETILVTGGAGFIGSNFIPYFMEKHPDYKIVNLDKLTYAGNLANLTEVENNPNYTFVQGDICDENLVSRLFDEHRFTGVIHFAAESHVDNSIKGPRAFINTNLVGTFNLLEAARTHWFDAPFSPKPGASTISPPTKCMARLAPRAFLRKPRLTPQTAPIRRAKPVRTFSFAPIITLSA